MDPEANFEISIFENLKNSKIFAISLSNENILSQNSQSARRSLNRRGLSSEF